MQPQSISFDTPFGQLAAQCWQHSSHSNAGGKRLILALHGWLDNSASFTRLAPLLVNEQQDLIAVDFPGHGHSDWLSASDDYYIWQPVQAMYGLLQQLEQYQQVILLGHSMGAASALLFAASFPQRIKAIIAMDALGPLTTPAEQMPQQLRQGIVDALSRAKRPVRQKVYVSQQQACEARVGKDQRLRAEDIQAVVNRNLKPIDAKIDKERSKDQGWCWRTDPRLRNSSKVRLTEAQVEAAMRSLTIPCLVLKADEGLIPQAMFDQRLHYLADAEFGALPGHHHFHLQAECVDAIAERIQCFLANKVGDNNKEQA